MTKEDQAKRNKKEYRDLWRGDTVSIVDTAQLEELVKQKET